MKAPLIFDIRRFSIHDGPGIRTTVFFKGCPLRCRWCHNPEGLSPEAALMRRPERCIGCGACARVCPLGLAPTREAGGKDCAACLEAGPPPCAEVCPSGALQPVGRRMDRAGMMRELRKDRPYYDESGGGVTFSGGEPLAYPEFLFDLLDACRKEGIRTAIETSAFASREVFIEASRRADLLLVDVKLMDSGRHRALTGLPNEQILGNIAALAELSASAASRSLAAVWLRFPIIPGLNDGPADLAAAADFAAGLAGDHKRGWPTQLLPYHDSARGKYALAGLPYPLPDTAPPDAEAMRAAAACFAARGVNVKIGGQV